VKYRGAGKKNQKGVDGVENHAAKKRKVPERGGEKSPKKEHVKKFTVGGTFDGTRDDTWGATGEGKSNVAQKKGKKSKHDNGKLEKLPGLLIFLKKRGKTA